MARFVVDPSVILHLLSENLEPAPNHRLIAPTLVRSEVLEALYRAVRRGDLPEEVAIDRLGHFATMKIRYLGDKVLRRRAWSVAEQLGWDSTGKAEYIALTQLQADALITLDQDLATEVAGLVEIAPLDALL